MNKLEKLLEILRKDYHDYGSKCAFKINEERKKEQDERCRQCDGYSSRAICGSYLNLLHLIKFYEGYNETTRTNNP